MARILLAALIVWPLLSLPVCLLIGGACRLREERKR